MFHLSVLVTDSPQSIGGFKGEAQNAPSGVNQAEKLRLLRSEGVLFDASGVLVDKGRWWDEFKN